MNSIIVRQMLGGDFYVIHYDAEIPSVMSVRAKLYEHYVGENGRNEIVMMFDNGGNMIGDDDVFKCDANDEKSEEKSEKGDEINVMMFVDREKKMRQEENDKVEEGIRTFMNMNDRRDLIENTFEKFRLAIIDAKAVIAGGSVLSSFGGFDINDLDIYVNYSNGKEFMSSLAKIGFKMSIYGDESYHYASQYDGSFFRKNNIQSRFYITREINNHYRSQSVDVMIIPDGYDVENVVTNFDLSFCEIWWNGMSTFATDPRGVRTKTGILKPDYRKSLFTEMNAFIGKRIHKYCKRGFTIDTCMAEFCRDHPDQAGVFLPKEKRPSLSQNHEEEWAMVHVRNVIENELELFMRPLIEVGRFNRHQLYFKLANNMEELTQQIGDTMDDIVRIVYYKKMVHMSSKYKNAFASVFHTHVFDSSSDEINAIDLSVFLSKLVENDLSPDQSIETLRTSYTNIIRQIGHARFDDDYQ